jgi:hypothetical protein
LALRLKINKAIRCPQCGSLKNLRSAPGGKGPARYDASSGSGLILSAEPSSTHLKGDDRTGRRPTRRYRPAKLIREAADNELGAKS